MESSQTQTPTANSSFLDKLDTFDKRLSLKVHGIGLEIPRWTLRALEYSGDGRFIIPVPASIWLAPVLFKYQELRTFLLNLYIALMFDLIFTGTVKSIIRRPRPIYNKDMYVFVSADHWSFPSGHASRAFLVAAYFWFYRPLWEVLSLEFLTTNECLEQIKSGSLGSLNCAESVVTIAGLSSLSMWAVATASSRVLLGRHYLMDVIAGTLLGLVEASFLHYVLHIPTDASRAIHNLMLAKLGIS